jgi:hypothetical protein
MLKRTVLWDVTPYNLVEIDIVSELLSASIIRAMITHKPASQKSHLCIFHHDNRKSRL